MILRSSLLESTGLVRVALSTRAGGEGRSPFGMNTSFKVGDDPVNVEESRRLLLASIGSTVNDLAIPLQVHSATIRPADVPGEYPECDGLVTNSEDVCLGVSVADCVPILMLDPKQRAIAAVHAGWRGTAAGIVKQAIKIMETEFHTRAKDLIAFIGPCADVCCYEVGKEVATAFDDRHVMKSDGKLHLNLKALNTEILIHSGILRSHIEVSPHCTISDSHLFHSFRRDKEHSGRMMAVIRLNRSIR